MKIAFHMDQICVRGTSVAVYDYMRYNESILKNKSILILPESSKTRNDPQGVARFSSAFAIYTYANLDALETLLEEEKCSILYCIKYGKNDGVLSKKVKTVVHCVFDMSEPHGDVYAGVSSALAKKYGKELFVPHMIGLTPGNPGDNYRALLRIPADAKVFGRYGGDDTFNIQFCWEVINEIVHGCSDIYFLFINTPQVVKHPNIFYFNKITSEEDKNRFINTCDAHLECGTLGHSFGLAIGEFSVNNKPIIAYKSPTLWNTSHLDILGDKGLYFTNKEEFRSVLLNFNKKTWEGKDMNCYKEYSPEKVMAIFSEVFILPPAQHSLDCSAHNESSNNQDNRT